MKKTTRDVFIKSPHPEVLMLNINWFSDQVSYMDTYAFTMSIANTFNIKDMFEIDPAENQFDEPSEYVLKGMICFVGAHYFSWIKETVKTSRHNTQWLKFDDDKPIYIFE